MAWLSKAKTHEIYSRISVSGFASQIFVRLLLFCSKAYDERAVCVHSYMVCVCRSEDNSQELVLPFCRVDSGDRS